VDGTLGRVDDEATGAAPDDEPPDPDDVDDLSPGDEIIDLPWDDDLPVALGEETEAREAPEGDTGGGGPADAEDGPPRSDWEHEYEFDGGEQAEKYFARRKAERRVDTWRTRSATGAIATAIAMGLQQVFEPEKRRPAAVAEAPSDPYSDDDPITVEYVPDDAEATTVRVKPWLLQKGDPS